MTGVQGIRVRSIANREEADTQNQRTKTNSRSPAEFMREQRQNCDKVSISVEMFLELSLKVLQLT